MRRQLTLFLGITIVGLTSLSLGLLLWKSFQDRNWVKKDYGGDIFLYESSLGVFDVNALTQEDVQVASDIDYISQKAAHLPGSKLYSTYGWLVVVSPSKEGGSSVFGTHLTTSAETLVGYVKRRGTEEDAVRSFFEFSHRPLLTLNSLTEIKAPAPKTGSIRITGRNVQLPQGWYLSTYRSPMGIDQSTFVHEVTNTLFSISSPYLKRDSVGKIRNPGGLHVAPPKPDELIPWDQFGRHGILGNVLGELIEIRCLGSKPGEDGDQLMREIFNYIIEQSKQAH